MKVAATGVLIVMNRWSTRRDPKSVERESQIKVTDKWTDKKSKAENEEKGV